MTDLELKIARMEIHMMNHPNDYQTAISLLINRSREYDYEVKKRHIENMKKVQQYKKGESDAEQTF